MKKQFLGNLALLQGLNLLIKPLWILGVDRAVQNTLPHNEYGIYFTLNNLCLLFAILLDMGITSFNNRSVARDHTLLPVYLRSFSRIRLILGLGYMLLILALFFLLGYNKALLPLLLLLAFNQVITSFNLYLRSNLSALHEFRTDSVISVLDRAVAIVTCSLLLWFILDGSFNIWWFVASQSLGLLVTLVTAFILVRARAKKIKQARVIQPGLKKLFRESLPYALLAALMAFYTRIDGVLLERLLPDGAEQAASYASGFRLLDAANMFAVLISGMLLPMFARMLAAREQVAELAWLSAKLMLIPAVMLAAVAAFFSSEIMQLMYKNYGHGDEVQVFTLLMLSFVPFCAIYVFGTLVTAMGHIRKLNIFAVLCLVINITLNLLLIPELKAKGAAISTLGTQCVFAFLCFLESRHSLELQRHFVVMLKMLAVFVIVTGTACLCKWYGLSWPLASMATGLAGILSSVLMKLFYLPNIIALLKRS